MSNLTDITNLSDAALDVVLEAKSGADFVDCAHLSSAERYQVANALGWPMDARTRNWCSDPAVVAPPARTGHDYELAILDRQDRTFND